MPRQAKHLGRDRWHRLGRGDAGGEQLVTVIPSSAVTADSAKNVGRPIRSLVTAHRSCLSKEGYGVVELPIFFVQGPPLTLAKGVSRSGYGRIFQLFSRVMRESLFTGLGARRHGSVLSEPIFSGPIACALLVNSLQAAETKASFIWCC